MKKSNKKKQTKTAVYLLVSNAVKKFDKTVKNELKKHLNNIEPVIFMGDSKTDKRVMKWLEANWKDDLVLVNTNSSEKRKKVVDGIKTLHIKGNTTVVGIHNKQNVLVNIADTVLVLWDGKEQDISNVVNKCMIKNKRLFMIKAEQ